MFARLWLRLGATIAAAMALLGRALLPEDVSHECLAEVAEGDEACSEEQVEGQEERLAEEIRTELLQREAQLLPRKSAAAVQAAAAAGVRGSAAAGHRRALELTNEIPSQQEPRWKLGEQTNTVLTEEGEEVQEVQTDETLAQAVRDAQFEGANMSSNVTADAVDCGAYPMFCDAKLDCAARPLTDADKAELDLRLATQDGHANPRSWCYGYPMYATSVQKCIVDNDPLAYAREMYLAQSELRLLDADATYCFAVGHCNNTLLTPNATIQEAETVCDQQFGHERWTNAGWRDMERVLKVAYAYESGQVSVESATWAERVTLMKNLSAVSAITACAMGNFHCDVAYCHVNYCQNEVYRARFGNLSWAW